MARLTRANYDSIRDHLFQRVYKTGEEIKNDFPNKLRFAIENQAWKQFTNAEGKPFKNLLEWLDYAGVNGIALGGMSYAINYKDALQLTKEVAPDVYRVLLADGDALKGKPGVKGKNGNELRVSTPLIARGNGRNKSAIVLSMRLLKEYPKHYEAYMRGDYKSVTAAAIEAGLLKNNANLRRAKSAWRKMTAAERKEFIKWIAALRSHP